MSSTVPGLFEVSLVQAVESLFEHAREEGINLTKERVKRIVVDAIEAGDLKPERLVRTPDQKIVLSETTIDGTMFLAYGQEWLCAHGLHIEPETNDYPRFPTVEIDECLVRWLTDALPAIREFALKQEYGVFDLAEIEEVLCAVFCSGRRHLPGKLRNAYSSRSVPTALPLTQLSQREETTHLNIIGALLELIQTPRSGRSSQTAVIREILDNYGEKYGISKATLEKKFAEANRSLRNVTP